MAEPHYLWIRDKMGGENLWINLGNTIYMYISGIFFKAVLWNLCFTPGRAKLPLDTVSLWWGACSYLPCHTYRVAKAAVSRLPFPSHAKLCAWSVLVMSEKSLGNNAIFPCSSTSLFVAWTLYLARLWSHSSVYCINISEALIDNRKVLPRYANKGKAYFQHPTKLQEVYVWSFRKENLGEM